MFWSGVQMAGPHGDRRGREWEIFVRISSSTLSINVPVLPSLPLPCINNLNGLFLFFRLGPARLSSSVTPEAVSVCRPE